jgi:diaminohydroxyphosphoribosylaminopyrimidine deaminase/5-amino-6-(5-phosphoribosylamino)uracil reductase
MREALALAKMGKGATAPNPCVGAVLVKDGQVAARGYHQVYGGPHAEVNCLADARDKGVDPALCSMYVTLEPCNHHGKTPPCAEALLHAGVPRVVIGCPDPNATVAGGGAKRLAEAGVEVVMGVAQGECRDMIRDFITWNQTNLPYIFVKIASTLDGRIATRTGHSQWVTGEESRAEVHRLRARVGAVIVGGGTFRADNPGLDARTGEKTPQPLAAVVTSRLPGAQETFKLLAHRPEETIFLTTQAAAASQKAKDLKALGCRVWGLPAAKNRGLDLRQGLERLREEAGVHYALCEGGGSLALSFMVQGLMHEFWHFTAPKILGDESAKPLMCGRAPETMDEAFQLRLLRCERMGEDMLCVYAPKENS